jgi:imidazolonepropionase-like amidohydrolase
MSADVVVLAGCSVVDVENADVLENVAIRIENGRITDIGPNVSVGGAQVTDLQGAWVTPGLWDCHAHLGQLIPDPTNYTFFETQPRRSIRAGHNAMDALRVGITTLRVPGEAAYIDLAWRDAFASGQFVGPRIFGAGPLMRCTGGHANRAPKRFSYLEQAIEIDGPDMAMRETRRQILMGVDFIKVAVTGGMSAGEGVDDLQLVREEISAICTVAHQRGLKVTAHAGGGQATYDAIEAGVDSIEHGYHLDERTIDLMRQRGTYLVPTIGVTHDDEFACEHEWTDAVRRKAGQLAPGHAESVRMAHANGIPICSGGDKYPIAESGIREIKALARAGLTPMQALQAATCNAAALMRSPDLGSVAPNKIADLAVWARNPAEDVEALDDLDKVFLAGRLVVDRNASGAKDPEARGQGVSVIGIPSFPG